MRRFVMLLVVCVVFSVVGVSPAWASSYEAELEAAIEYYFEGYDEATAHAIVACESGYGADIFNEASGAYGPWQFLASTSYALGFDHSAMGDPWYSTWAASEYHEIAGWSPWVCAW